MTSRLRKAFSRPPSQKFEKCCGCGYVSELVGNCLPEYSVPLRLRLQPKAPRLRLCAEHLVVGKSQSVIGAEILAEFVTVKAVEPSARRHPYMTEPVFGECRDFLVGKLLRDDYAIVLDILWNILRAFPATGKC